ncbi:MAG: dihydropteroate synthase [Desulfuromonas sp.]|nr:dihydropteroate synthase [Desulfuromonas sp.]
MAAGTGILLSGPPAGPGYLLGHDCRIGLDRPRLMGVLNVTPDSFSDGGRFFSVGAALTHARQLVAQGADLIDVGGESTRPGAPPVSVQEELDRVMPVVEALRREIALPISLDTTKSAVAAAAVAAGAEFINDVSGLTFDPDMAATVAAVGAGLFVMHTRGGPETMQADTCYTDLVGEVRDSLRRSVAVAVAAGVAPERIAVDPGVGFGKDVAGNLELLRRLNDFAELGRPILLGTSRKSFIGRVLGQDDPLARQAGTLATVALGVAAGARLFRVHEVGPAREAAMMAWAVCRGAEWHI